MTAPVWKGRTLDLPIALTRMLQQGDVLLTLGDQDGTAVATPSGVQSLPSTSSALQSVRALARSHPRTLEVLELFRALTADEGSAPTVRELSRAMGRTSNAACYTHLVRLVEMGLLERRRRGARNYRIPKGVDLALHVHLRTERDAVGVSRATRVA